MLLFLAFMSVCMLTPAQNGNLFEQGNALYNQGKYADAIDKYSAILNSGYHSAELYFNMGNANYKLNNIAPSIYYYEKALLLQPNDKDIKNNLAYARNMTIDAIDVMPEVGFSKFINTITHTFSYDVWAIMAIFFVFLFVVLVLYYYFSYTSRRKRFAFTASVLCLIFLGATLALAFHRFNLDKANNPAIIFAQESPIKTEPNLRSEEAFRLHEGTKVQIIDTLNNWKKIKLSDGKIGWISADDIKLIR